MIIEAAKIYDQFLVRKDFLYVYGENYFEVSFPVDHFRHLTGVNSMLNAKEFYRNARKGKLTTKQLYFDEHYLMNLAFIKLTYLYLDDFEYVDIDRVKTNAIDETPDKRALYIPDNIMDQIRLVSTYKSVAVSSMLFDSTGTKKMVAIAGYVIEALEKDRVLVIDELDSSLHFKLTRAIVAMFNNELNTNAQMIFTAHDINLMDCKKLFRKEQIWFVHKDNEGVYVYSLADFTAKQGVKDTTDVIIKKVF